MQLALSFGHVHAHGNLTVAGTATPSSCASSGSAKCPSHDNDDEAHCSICWTLSIAGSLIVAAPVALLVPSFETATVIPLPVQAFLANDASLQFQPRGPPHTNPIA